MGIIVNTVRGMAALLPEFGLGSGSGSGSGERETKMPAHAVVPIFQSGLPVYPQQSYQNFALDGYTRNEIVFAAIEERATSASEPRFVAYRRTAKGKQQLEGHPAADLLEHPNPFWSRSNLVGQTIMHLDLAGNAYWEKVRTGSGAVVELWPIRPDRMRVVPDARRFIRAYQYQLGTEIYELDPRDVIHFKTRHPLDDYYGLATLAAAAGRVDTDNSMRQFVTAFFQNAGVPAGLLNLEQDVSVDQRDALRNRFRSEFGGPQGWHSLLVLGGGKATYQSMGMPLGDRGLVLPELQNISEARIAMVFGVPLILIGARLGMEHNTYSNYQEARRSFWDETLSPLYSMIASTVEMSLLADFTGLDGVEFDLGDVQALQEKQDALHERARANAQAAIWTVEEARTVTGMDPVPTEGYYLLPISVAPTPAAQITQVFEDQQAQAQQQQQDQQADGGAANADAAQGQGQGQDGGQTPDENQGNADQAKTTTAQTNGYHAREVGTL